MLNSYRYLNTDVHIYTQEKTQRVRLLQMEKLNPLSYVRDEKGQKPAMIINCSYFTSGYVCGRNQGDLYNNTHDQNYIDVVLLKDNSYKFGNFKSWDYQTNPDVVAGFSVAGVLIKNGVDCTEFSKDIPDAASRLTTRSQQTALVILKDKTKVAIVSEGRTTDDNGLTGAELRTFLRTKFADIEFMCLFDGGGSSEMIVNGKIVNQFQTGAGERPMFNGLAFIEDQSVEVEPENLMCPFKKMKVTQYDGGEYSHKGSDAWDITDGIVGSKAAYYAPVDMECKAVNKTYAFTWWQSLYPVKFADGSTDFVTIMFGHDEDINATVGMRVGKGVQVGNMGAGGNATGVHCHIEVAKGKFTETWKPNEFNVYCLPNSIKFYDAFYMDDVELLSINKDVMAKFKYLDPSKNPYKEDSSVKIEALEAQVKLLNQQLAESKAQVMTLNSRIAQLTADVSTYQSKLDKANAAFNSITNIVNNWIL